MTDSMIWSLALWMLIFLAIAILTILVTDHIYNRGIKDEYDRIEK